MIIKIIFAMILFHILFISSAIGGGHNITNEDDYIPVSLCDLSSNSDIYNAKKVVVRTSYKWNWEWTKLYGSKCSENHIIWPVFIGDPKKNIKKIFKGKQKSGIHTATLYGIFYSTGPRLCPECFTLNIMDIADHVFVREGSGAESINDLSQKEQKLVCKGDEMPNKKQNGKKTKKIQGHP